MSENSAIEWTDHTFSPWHGCAKVSAACTHCYAETFSKRLGHDIWGPEARRRFFGEKHWAAPLKWNRKAEKDGVRRKVFCASMADVFEQLPDGHPDRVVMEHDRRQLWRLIEDTPHLDWLLLTKRPYVQGHVPAAWFQGAWPANAWMGVTAENQEQWDRRVGILVNLPAPVRFVSVEPMLEHINTKAFLPVVQMHDVIQPRLRWARSPGTSAIHWVICGGESGAGARPMLPEWVMSLRDQCQVAGVAFLFKQWGGVRNKRGGNLAILDGQRHVAFPEGSSA